MRRASARLSVRASCSKSVTSEMLSSQTARCLLCYSMSPYKVCSTAHLSSAKQPLVQAPAVIRESALLRKLNAAGAHATLSPARRGKENAPGPSSRRMEAVGEEDEEDQEVLGDEPRKTYDAGVRQRELANQKARIVSQMTGRDRAGTDRSSPRRSATTTPTGGLHPAKRVAAASDAGGRVHPAALRVSLFDATRHNLDKGLEMGETFSTPRGFCFHQLR